MDKKTSRLWIFRIIRIAVLAYLGLCALAYIFQERLIFLPSSEWVATPGGDAELAYEDVTLTTADGVELSAWYIPSPHNRGVVLLCHGNAGNISHRMASIQVCNELGYNVLIFDYRGYGRSKGKPTEEGTYQDAMAAWDYLVKAREFPPEKIVILGRSMGGGVATWLARETKPGGLILESCYTSMTAMAKKLFPWLPVKLILKHKYNNLEKLADVSCPVLVIHSQEDEIIPYEHGIKLFAAANGPKTLVTIFGDHNGGFVQSGNKYFVGLRDFFRELESE
ncbi:MAG: alpha/beta hydrolase [Planctomycetes bacterium]|nr:alpha/beta hydrolase [Planctomycetota bacterium]